MGGRLGGRLGRWQAHLCRCAPPSAPPPHRHPTPSPSPPAPHFLQPRRRCWRPRRRRRASRRRSWTRSWLAADAVLLEQRFVMDEAKSVKAVAAAAGLEVAGFVRLQVGEGVEKGGGAAGFAADVAAMVQGG